MKFGLMFANTGAFGRPEDCAELVSAAEDVGIESLWTVEHVAVPRGYESAYPYSSTGRMPGGEDAPIPDPVVWLSFVAAISHSIRLATGILILPQRHPLYVAKEFATLDQMSGGRAILGVGIGWLAEEFAAANVPFETRAARTEESIQALRSLWQPGASTFEGSHFKWSELESNPKPLQPGGVPIVIGGHVPAAARRAARFGDGFFPGRVDRLDELLNALRAECKAIGRDPSEIELTTGVAGRFDVDAVKRMQDQGIDRLILPPPGRSKADIRSRLEGLAEAVLSKL